MSRRNLTSKQHDFLQYLHGHLQQRKVWPTYREIVAHFSYSSPNSVTQNLQALAKKGYIQRDHNGYHLVEQSGGEGSVPVRAALRGGRVEPAAPAERLTLASLLPELGGLSALRLDETAAQPGELADARYVLFGDDPVGEGETAVVLHDGEVSLRRVGRGGHLQDAGGRAAPLHSAEAEVLGRYAGHAGPYGLVRASRAPAQAKAAPVADGMEAHVPV